MLAYAVWYSVHSSVRSVKNWCRVIDIATNKNCDSARCYEQFARYNILFYNPEANSMKPNTNSNHKTDLTTVNYRGLRHQLKLVRMFFGCNITGATPTFTECCYFVGIRGAKSLSRSNFFLAVRLQLFHSDQVAWEIRQVWIGSWQCTRSSREWICPRRLSCIVNWLSREYVRRALQTTDT